MSRRFLAVVFAASVLAGAASHAAPRVVNVGIYVLNLGKLDIGSGSYTADFYLSMKSAEPIPANSFEFMNGRAGSVEEVEAKPDGTERFYRILANLNTPIDLKKFPFDRQRLEIVIEDKTAGIEKVKYVPEPAQSGLDAGISFPGWSIAGWSITSAAHDYPVYGEQYSQLLFSVNIGRVRMNSFLKTFLPVVFLMLIVMSSFVLNPDQIATRLAAISSALVASAMFHISIAGQIPPVGYLTFADKFMVLTYFILLACFFISLRVFILQGRKEEARAARLSRIAERIVFAGMPILYAGLFLLC